jgi:menaquinone-dependent protoporphyrinogen IX oxidase
MKTLIVYFTRTGNTKKIVDELQAGLAADAEEIKEKGSRRGLLGWLKSGRQGASKADVEIQPLDADPKDYGLVVLASPVWAGNVSAPMRAFIKSHRDSLPDTAVFLTHDSPDVTQAFADVDELLGKTPVARGEASREAIQGGGHHEAVQGFIEGTRSLTG